VALIEDVMDEITQFNKSRWELLAQARVAYSQPFLQLTPENALDALDPDPVFVGSRFAQVAGKDVLVLAGGGGQQTAVFGLLGAQVTVIDLTETQLARDREAAAHYGYSLRVEQGDMRDLSRFADNSFDLVWHPFSINFIPDAAQVLREAGRVLRPGGFYHIQFANPYWSMDDDQWLPQGYPIRQPYVSGSQLAFGANEWTFTNDQGEAHRIEGPHEFLHTWSTMINTLAETGFVILGMREGPPGDSTAVPGTWEHLLTIVPPFVALAAVYAPGLMQEVQENG
jgi:SAM-dependent methyltransferase